MEEAVLGQVSKSTASRICRELRARYKAFCARSLADVELLALFLDAIYLPTRPSGEKEGVLVAWGYTIQGKRVLVAVRLGQRERHEDWLDLGRDLTRRGLRAPWLVVSDGAPGLVKPSTSYGPKLIANGAPFIVFATFWRSYPSDPSCSNASRALTGQLWMRRSIPRMPSDGCANWSAVWSTCIRAPPLAWLRICQ